jgi:hypothetical protein
MHLTRLLVPVAVALATTMGASLNRNEVLIGLAAQLTGANSWAGAETDLLPL